MYCLYLIKLTYIYGGKSFGTLEIRWVVSDSKAMWPPIKGDGRWDAGQNILILTHVQYNGRWSIEDFQQLGITGELVEVIGYKYHFVLPISHVDSLNHVTK